MKTITLALACLLAATSAHAAPDWAIRRKGTQLMRNGAPWHMVGGNQYRAAGGPPALSCQMAQSAAEHTAKLDAHMAQMQVDGFNTLRVWAFQSYAGPTGTDFSAFSRLIQSAKLHHIRLIMVLENQWGDCSEGGYKSPDWYRSGYAAPYGKYSLSLPAYATALVSRFKGEQTIAAWQLVNEAESQDGFALATFAARMARTIKSIDKLHLLSVGTLACGQPGTDAANMRRMHTNGNVDIIEAHDYNNDRTPLTPCIAENLLLAQSLNKPFIIGELGLNVINYSPEDLGQMFRAKLKAYNDAGVNGWLIWSIYSEGPTDGYGIIPGSPAHRAMVEAAKY